MASTRRRGRGSASRMSAHSAGYPVTRGRPSSQSRSRQSRLNYKTSGVARRRVVRGSS